jgi:D-glycero-D-manno-heptose 1,7-bisphosphate phosphatase
MPLIVLDRDGVINEDLDNYIRSVTDWHPIPGSLAAIADLCRAGFTVAIATNQSGLSRGFFGLDELEAIHARLCQQVEEEGGHIAGIFYCPHLPEVGCECRKPGTGLLAAIETELGVSPRGAIFIGDSLRDLQAAQAYGCQPVLVETGRGNTTLDTLRSGRADLAACHSIPTYANLAAAVQAILRDQPDAKSDTWTPPPNK